MISGGSNVSINSLRIVTPRETDRRRRYELPTTSSTSHRCREIYFAYNHPRRINTIRSTPIVVPHGCDCKQPLGIGPLAARESKARCQQIRPASRWG